MQGQTRQAQAAATYARDLAAVMPRATLDDAARRFQTAQQEVAGLQAVLDQAAIQLSRYQVQAPIVGTVIARFVDLGQLADTTTRLFTLADLSVLTVETKVEAAYAADSAVGQKPVMQLVGSAVLVKRGLVARPTLSPSSNGPSQGLVEGDQVIIDATGLRDGQALG